MDFKTELQLMNVRQQVALVRHGSHGISTFSPETRSPNASLARGRVGSLQPTPGLRFMHFPENHMRHSTCSLHSACACSSSLVEYVQKALTPRTHTHTHEVLDDYTEPSVHLKKQTQRAPCNSKTIMTNNTKRYMKLIGLTLPTSLLIDLRNTVGNPSDCENLLWAMSQRVVSEPGSIAWSHRQICLYMLA